MQWVLATSPEDQLRNGQRSLELAQKACEKTEYEQAHILSTLAASYAELGNFEEAVKWSSKAAELDPDEEQLAKEMASYQEQKTWREKQQVEENTEPLPVIVDDDDLPFDELPIEESTEESTEDPAQESTEPPAEESPAAEEPSQDPLDEPAAPEEDPSKEPQILDQFDVPSLPLR